MESNTKGTQIARTEVDIENIYNEVHLITSARRLFLTQQPVSTSKVSLKLRVCSSNIGNQFTLTN